MTVNVFEQSSVMQKYCTYIYYQPIKFVTITHNLYRYNFLSCELNLTSIVNNGQY